MTKERRLARLTQCVRDLFENHLMFVYESRGVYWVARQRDSEHPETTRTLRAIGTVDQKMSDLKRQIREWEAEEAREDAV